MERRDFLKDNKLTHILINFGMGFVAGLLVFWIIGGNQTDMPMWQLGLAGGVIGIVAPLLGDLLIDKL